MPKVPDSTRASLEYKVSMRAKARWPQLAGVNIRHRGGFAYLDALMPDGDIQPLCRLRYGGSAATWGFAIYRASHDDYEDSLLPDGLTAGTRRRSRHRLWPLPRRPHRLAMNPRRINEQQH